MTTKEYHRNYKRGIRSERKKKGLCTHCGKKKNTKAQMCGSCTGRMLNWAKERASRRKKYGSCVRCNNLATAGLNCFERANVDKVLGMHCAVLGSTGSDKSGAVAALLHSMLDHKPEPERLCYSRILVIDPHGEYGRAFKERAIVYRAYDPLGNEENTGSPS